MKPALISMRQWLSANERTRALSGDQWYINFAAKVSPIVKQSLLFKENNYMQKNTTILLCIYFQDATAQTGGQKILSESYYSLYNTYLPFYQLLNGYIPDEASKENIAFVLWTLRSHAALYKPGEYALQDPYDKNLLTLAQEVYTLMGEDFRKTPINEESSSMLWVMGPDLLEMPSTPLPEIAPETKLSKNIEYCLEYSGGRPLLYFAIYKKLCKFFVDILRWENFPSSLLPDLQDKKELVIYANAKSMLIAHNIAAYFYEEHNPVYNSGRAAVEDYKLFCRSEACPFGLIKYGVAKGILPDIQLPFPNDKEILYRSWSFIACYYLYEYYEGDQKDTATSPPEQ